MKDPTLTIPGELMIAPDTLRLCLRGLPIAQLSSIGRLRRENRRITLELPDDTLLPATLDSTPAGVVIQFNGRDLRPLNSAADTLRVALSAIQELWADVSMPRLDWAVQREFAATLGAEVLDASLRLGFTDGGHNKMLTIVGTSGVTYRRYWSGPAQSGSGAVRSCGVDEIELHVYTAHDGMGGRYWRIEVREYLFARAAIVAPHPLTMALLAEVGLGVIELPRLGRLASSRQDDRNARRAVGLFIGSRTVSDALVAASFAEVYGLPTNEQLIKSARLKKIFTGKQNYLLDSTGDPPEDRLVGCIRPGQQSLRRSDGLRPCR